MNGFGGWFDGLWRDAGESLAWLTGQWWFWLLVILLTLGVLVFLSALFWRIVVRVGFSSWRRTLVSVPVCGVMVLLVVWNFTAVWDWVNLYWPLTAFPVLLVLGLPLAVVVNALTGGSRPRPESRISCPSCGGAHAIQNCSGPGWDGRFEH